MDKIASVPMLVTAIVLSAAVLALHVLCALCLRGRVARVVGYINIFLHAPLLVSLVLSGADFKWGVLLMAASAFIYTLLRFVPYTLAGTRKPTADSDTGEGTV